MKIDRHGKAKILTQDTQIWVSRTITFYTPQSSGGVAGSKGSS